MHGLPLPDDGGDGIAPPPAGEVPTDTRGLTVRIPSSRRGFTGQASIGRGDVTGQTASRRRGFAARALFSRRSDPAA
ncbi:hypothetical protein ACF1G5_29325 [Streptomyces coeruleorubidus]|uniref:hypothetical protein n=1 Tax=Streptomyces coeruleorubidus TaxID=116188 RepID=UPI0037020089